MASITAGNPDEELERRLRIRAVRNQNTMEQDAGDTPTAALQRDH